MSLKVMHIHVTQNTWPNEEDFSLKTPPGSSVSLHQIIKKKFDTHWISCGYEVTI